MFRFVNTLAVILLLAVPLSGQLICAPQPANDAQNSRSDADTSLAQARRLVDNENFDEAESLTREFLTRHADSADGHFLLGFILFRETQAKPGAAAPPRYTDPDAVTSGHPWDAKARASLAEYTVGARYRDPNGFDLKIVALDYVLLNDLADVDKWMTQSLRRSPRDAEGWYYLGRAKYGEDRYDKAIEDFEKSLALAPHDANVEDNLGLSYAAVRRFDEATAAYRTAIEWQQSSAKRIPGPYRDLGLLLMEQNRLEEAVPYLKQAVAISPREPELHKELGNVYMRQKLFDKAQAEFESAVQLAPEDPVSHYLLGRVYKERGLTEKARSEFVRCAALNGRQALPSSSDVGSPQH